MTDAPHEPSSPGSAPRRRGGAPGLATLAAVLGVVLAAAAPASGQSLRGSHASMDVQNREAREHDFTFLSSSSQVRRFIDLGLLVPIRGNRDYDIARVSFPFGRPEIRLFIERLAGQYRRACGEKLVVTSLTRPQNRQPVNASSRSVHPTGMAIDLRRSNRTACRRWLEDVLLYLEERGVLEATRERRPPHYHVAVFPEPYAAYVDAVTSRERVASGESVEYRVRRGDSLWEIARKMGVSVAALRSANDVDPDRIYPGQRLVVPGRGGGSVADDARVARGATDAGDAPSASTASAGGPRFHTHRVRPGDSLWEIARATGISVLAIRAANDLPNERIHPGQTLRIPASEDAVTVTALRYRVRPGDSLWEIAREHRTTVGSIRRQNGLGSSRIVAGQVLTVPVGR